MANDRYNTKKFLALFHDAIKLLHPQHDIICEISRWMIPIFCRGIGGEPLRDFPVEDMALKQKLCIYHLNVLKRVNPGISKMTGIFLLHYIQLYYASVNRILHVYLSQT